MLCAWCERQHDHARLAWHDRHDVITFTPMQVRRYIAAIALSGLHLLQGILPAAGDACERLTTTAVIAPAAGTAVGHHHEMVSDQASPNHARTTRVALAAPAAAPGQHRHAPAACPMAMACTVVGVSSSPVAVTIAVVAIDVHRSVQTADWPVSLDIAPEPPPPRG